MKAIVAAMAPALGGASGAVRRATANPQAYDLYLKGRHLWNQRSPSVVGAAIACFEGAIALDARFARGLCGPRRLLFHPARLRLDAAGAGASRKALEAVTRALALDPQLPEAHRPRGSTRSTSNRIGGRRRGVRRRAGARPERRACHATYGMFLATAYRYADARGRLDARARS